MHTLDILGRTFGPYEAIAHADGSKKGDLRPILYDAATIRLSDGSRSFSLGYKISKNLFGKELRYVDVIDMSSGESFSLQVSNVFLITVVAGDIKILAKVGSDLKFYEDFGKTEYRIESDGDKKELTPLGYFDMFVRYDDEYYYPIILDPEIARRADVLRFYDYYGFKSYTDDAGGNHFILLIEAETSTEERPVWYWTDNFRKSSDILDFWSESEVDNWELDNLGRISMTLTDGTKWHVDASGKMTPGALAPSENAFSYTRYFEDTDSDTIVGKDARGCFLIDKHTASLSAKEQSAIVYFADFIACAKEGNTPYFLVKNLTGDVVVVNADSEEILTTDLSWDEAITGFAREADGAYCVSIDQEGVRKYVAG